MVAQFALYKRLCNLGDCTKERKKRLDKQAKALRIFLDYICLGYRCLVATQSGCVAYVMGKSTLEVSTLVLVSVFCLST